MIMLKIVFALVCVGTLSNQSFADQKVRGETNEKHGEVSQRQIDHLERQETESEGGELVTSSVTDITAEYAGDSDSSDSDLSADPETRSAFSRTPKAPVKLGSGSTIGKAIGSGLSQVTLSQLVTLGEKIWNYVLDNKPTAQLQTIKASIVPNGITDWTQLIGWSPPVAKVYHVQFRDALGAKSGSFDYRITFVPGGSYQGHGKFLGEIEFTPMHINLATGRSLNVTAELSSPLNFGTVTNPVAAAQLLVSWTTPTLTHYQMQSAEYFIYGSGAIQDLSSGSANE
jgi:hypothetical protein